VIATGEQRAQFELRPRGMHSEVLDEDISMYGQPAVHGDRTQGSVVAPA
jgi:hypothetical protein